MSNNIQSPQFAPFPVTESVVAQSSEPIECALYSESVCSFEVPIVYPSSVPIGTDPGHSPANEDPLHNKQSLIQDIGTDNLYVNIVRFNNVTLETSKYSGRTQESLNSNYFSSLTLGVHTNSIDTNAVQQLIQDNTQILQQPEQLASGSIFNY